MLSNSLGLLAIILDITDNRTFPSLQKVLLGDAVLEFRSLITKTDKAIMRKENKKPILHMNIDPNILTKHYHIESNRS